ncbi:MAG TPA: alpha/beta hydrolase [Anaeromyxobacteraceae bacterium]|nr:alpha/beta hydrolase [Anaeromyxobacteraceae bacterium]
MQRRFLYFPDRQDPGAALRDASRLGYDPVRDRAGALLGWRSRHPSGRAGGTALVLHGNAGHALHRAYLPRVLQAPGVPPVDVLLLEYPGYGPRPGKPTEASLVEAAVEAVDLLAPAGPVLLVGESLGSAVASLAAARRPGAVRGLLLVTPLASVPAVARRHAPLVPSFLLRDRYESAPALARFGGPVAFLLAGEDEVVFADLGRSLHDGYRGPRRLAVQQGASHNTLRYDAGDPTWRESVSFLLGG